MITPLNYAYAESGTLNLFKKINFSAIGATCQQCMFE